MDQDRGARAITRERNSVEMPFANFETVSPGQMRLRAWSVNLARTFCPPFARPGPAFGHSSRLVQALRGSVTSRGDAPRLARRRGKHAYRSLALARI